MGAQTRHAAWQVVETAGFESAWISLDGAALHADVLALGQLPEPYRLAYTLRTDERGATTRLRATTTTPTGRAELDLCRSADTWTVNGWVRPDLAGALDCDVACSPLTNTPPILRNRLHRTSGAARPLVAFVQVPTLAVVACEQAYTHLRPAGRGAAVRYASGTFASDLTVDRDGLVVDYPGMARRVAAVALPGAARAGGVGTPRPGSVAGAPA